MYSASGVAERAASAGARVPRPRPLGGELTQHDDGEVVERLVRVCPHLAQHRLHQVHGAAASLVRDERLEPVGAEQLVATLRLGEPVRVDDERITGGELDHHVAIFGLAAHAEQHAARLDLLDAAIRAADERWREPAFAIDTRPRRTSTRAHTSPTNFCGWSNWTSERLSRSRIRLGAASDVA
jgi:hypothetical protein